MYILYADDAGNTGTDYDNKQQPIFTLTGVIVEAEKWNEINEHISREKRKFIPDFPDCEIHATDIYNGSKSKDKCFDFRQYGLQGNLNILEKFVNLIVEIQLPIITFAVRKSNLKRYCQSKYKMSIKIDPYLIAFSYVSVFFDYYLESKKSKGLIFLDEQRELITNIDRILEELKLISSSEKLQIKIKNIIEKALFLDSARSNFIQIADICNFYINRYLSMKHGVNPHNPIKAEHITKMYYRIKPLILPYPHDPYTLKEMLIFFEDNKELFDKK